MQQTFEKFLENWFIDLREVSGKPITKDNFEDMLSSYMETFEIEDIIKLGELYGQQQYIAGKEAGIDIGREIITGKK